MELELRLQIWGLALWALSHTHRNPIGWLGVGEQLSLHPLGAKPVALATPKHAFQGHPRPGLPEADEGKISWRLGRRSWAASGKRGLGCLCLRVDGQSQALANDQSQGGGEVEGGGLSAARCGPWAVETGGLFAPSLSVLPLLSSPPPDLGESPLPCMGKPTPNPNLQDP